MGDKWRIDRRGFVGLTAAGTASALLLNAADAQAAPKPPWQPDGANLTRIGLLVPGPDITPESEIAAMNRGRASVFASRMPIQFTRAGLTDPTHADSALELLKGVRPRAILYAATSTSYFLDVEGEKAFRSRLETRALSVPVIFPAAATTDALRVLGIGRIALVHPPWFSDEMHELGPSYFQARGFDVVSSTRIKPPRRLSEVSPDEVYRWIVANTPPRAEAVVQAGNGLRTIGAIDALEAALGRPVITANQAMFWRGLRVAGVTDTLAGYGRLFAITARSDG